VPLFAASLPLKAPSMAEKAAALPLEAASMTRRSGTRGAFGAVDAPFWGNDGI
jgi:hypothetical protein